MEKRRALMGTIGLGTLGATAALVIACGSGSGPLVEPDPPYDRAPSSRDNPGTSVDSPGVSGDAPPASGDNPGNKGCPPCDGTFSCTTVTAGSSDKSTLVLKSVGGACAAIDSKGQAQGVLACDGTIVSAGGVVGGSWQATGSDSFSAVTTATVTTTSNGKTTTTSAMSTTTCTRTSSSTTPPTATSTNTGTPVTQDAGKGG